MKLVLPAVCSVILLVSTCFSARAEEPKTEHPKTSAVDRSAIDAARDYTSLIKAGKGSTASQKYWDAGSMVQTVFGDHLKQHSADEVKEIERLWLGFISTVFANPDTLAAMKRASFVNFKSTDDEDGQGAVVTYQTKLGDKTISNKLRMKKSPEGWKVVDLATNGQLFVGSLQKAYEPQAKKVTPLKFMQALAAQQPGAKK